MSTPFKAGNKHFTLSHDCSGATTHSRLARTATAQSDGYYTRRLLRAVAAMHGGYREPRRRT